MKEYLKFLVSSIFAGFLIGVGGSASVLLKSTSHIFSTFIFTVGIVSIVAMKTALFTGRVSYFFDNPKKEIKVLPIVLLGNAIGVFLVSIIMRLSNPNISEVANTIVSSKLQTPIPVAFLLACLCGLMVFIAIHVQTVDSVSGTAKIIIAIMAIMGFVFCGFEHSIADILYFTLAGEVSWYGLLFIISIILGNSVGAILSYNATKFIKK